MAKNWKEEILKKIKELNSHKNILTVFDEKSELPHAKAVRLPVS